MSPLSFPSSEDAAALGLPPPPHLDLLRCRPPRRNGKIALPEVSPPRGPLLPCLPPAATAGKSHASRSSHDRGVQVPGRFSKGTRSFDYKRSREPIYELIWCTLYVWFVYTQASRTAVSPLLSRLGPLARAFRGNFLFIISSLPLAFGECWPVPVVCVQHKSWSSRCGFRRLRRARAGVLFPT